MKIVLKLLRDAIGQKWSRLWNQIRWLLPGSVSTKPIIAEYFNLTKDEIAMIDACIEHGLLREMVCRAHDEDALYIVLSVSDCRSLIKRRRKTMEQKFSHVP